MLWLRLPGRRTMKSLLHLLAFGRMLSALVGYSGAARATLILAVPDLFPEFTVLTDAFPGVTLTVEGHPGIPVLARVGIVVGGPTAGQNIAPTGELVFGHTLVAGPPPAEDFLILWTTGSPAPSGATPKARI